ncbi:MAG: hypothetical protein IJ122_06160 [Methanobrevibacter sp.]|nr:hypothetical protein [Methanobrevibacter sp.]
MDNNTAGRVKYVITADSTDFERSLGESDAKFKKFASSVKSGASLIDKALAQIPGTAASSLSYLQNYSRAVIDSLSGIGSAIKGIGFDTLKAGSAALASTTASMAAAGISDTKTLEDLQIKMIALTHSVEDGEKAVGAAVRFYKNNPFNRFETFRATSYLLQYGQTVDSLADSLETLGYVSLSTGTDIASLSYIYGRILAQGKVTYGDLQYFTEKGLNIYGELERATGKTQAEIIELASNGELELDAFKKAFAGLGDQVAYELNDATLSRALDKFRGRLSDLKGAIAGYTTTEEGGFFVNEQGLYRSYSAMLFKFADLMRAGHDIGKSFRESLTRIGETIGKIIDIVTEKMEPALRIAAKVLDYVSQHTEILVGVLGGAMVMFGNLAGRIPVVGDIISSFTGKIGVLWTRFKGAPTWLQILLAILGSGAVKALMSGKLNESFKIIVDSLGKIYQALEPVVEQIVRIFADIGAPVIESLLGATANVLKVIADILQSIPTEVLTTVVMSLIAFKGVQSAVEPVQNFVSVFSKLKDAISAAGSLKGGLDIFKQVVGGGAEGTAKTLASTMNTLSGPAQQATTMGDSLKDGLKTMIEIIGILVGAAVALTILDRGVQSDFPTLALKIAGMGLAIVEIGALALIMGFVQKIGKGVILNGLVGLEEIAVVLLSLGVAMTVLDRGVTSDFVTLACKLGNLGIAVTEIGVLAGIVGGIFATGVGFVVMQAGFAGLLEIAGVLASIGGALAVVDSSIPEDSEKLKKKVKAIGDICGQISEISVGGFWNNLFNGARLGPIVTIVGEYKQIAKTLAEIDQISFNYETIREKVKTLSKVVKLLTLEQHEGEEFNYLKNIKQNAQAFFDADLTGHAGRIIKTYGDMLDEIKKIESFEFIENGQQIVEQNIEKIASIVRTLMGQDETGQTNKLNGFNQLDAFAQSGLYKQREDVINVAKSIIEMYTSLIPKINELAEAEIDAPKAAAKVSGLFALLQIMFSKDAEYKLEGFEGTVPKNAIKVDEVRQKESIVSYVESIIDKFTKIVPLLQKLTGEDFNFDKGSVETKFTEIQSVIATLQNFNRDNQGFQITNSGEWKSKDTIISWAQSIVNKFTELTPVLRRLDDPEWSVNAGSVKTKIGEIQDVVYKLSQINQYQRGDWDDKEWIVGMASSIAHKFTYDLIPVLRKLLEEDSAVDVKTAKDKIWELQNLCYELSKVNQEDADSWETKIEIVGWATQIANKLIEFTNSVNNIPDIKEGALTAFSSLVETINLSMSLLFTGLKDREIEFTEIGTNYAENLKNAWTEKDAKNHIISDINSIISTLSSDDYKNRFRNIGNDYAVSVFDEFSKHTDAAWDSGYSVGYWIGEGLRQALADAVEKVAQAARNLSDTTVQTISFSLQINSPSKVMYKLGEYVGQGFAEGIQSQGDLIRDSLIDITDSISNPFSDLKEISYNLSGDGRIGSGISNKTNTFNQTNNIYTEFDANKYGRDLMWQVTRI